MLASVALYSYVIILRWGSGVGARRSSLASKTSAHLTGIRIERITVTCMHFGGPAMQRAAELAHGLAYDLCVLTGYYRGRTHGDCRPCAVT